MGKRVAFPRRTAAFGLDYKYAGQTAQAKQMDEAPAAMRGTVSEWQSLAALTSHNAALVNYYDAKDKEYIGAHSDNEKELVRHQPVVSLSWNTAGHFRRFRFTVKRGVTGALQPDWGAGPGVLHLHNGDLVVMGGTTQETHKHELMKPTNALGENAGWRINVTLRAFHEVTASRSRKRRGVGVHGRGAQGGAST